MKVEKRKRQLLGEYVCELTQELDKVAGFEEKQIFKHYLVIDNLSKKERCLPIRVPGGTVGSVWYDENNIITKIEVDTDYVVKTYSDKLNDLIDRFIGEKIEF